MRHLYLILSVLILGFASVVTVRAVFVDHVRVPDRALIFVVMALVLMLMHLQARDVAERCRDDEPV